MNYEPKTIRTFIGAKNYDESRTFYQELGFEEVVIADDMSLFKVHSDLGFYLQKYYVKDWVNNSMVFLEVDDVDKCRDDLNQRGLHNKYKLVRLTPIKTFEWGRECFMHDPSGVLWHFAEFN
ncbi:MAG: VOC family protein [Cyclobacteriaceae bacterium]